MRDWQRRVRPNDPQTSWAAAASVNLPRSQRLVVTLLENYGPSTADEVECHALAERLPLSPSRVRTALTELAEKRYVGTTGELRRTRYGREARVWALAADRAA